MFTLRRPTVFVPLVVTVVAALVGGFLLMSRSGGGNLLSAGRPNCPPIARNDATLTAPDQPVTVDVLANDSDVDGDKLRFEVINVSAGSAEVDFAGGSAQKLVYTPATPDGSTAKVNYRVTDAKGDVSTAVVTVAITSTGELPAGLTSAAVGDSNGEALETRCIKAAKGSTTTTPTAEVGTAPEDVPDDGFVIDGSFDEPSDSRARSTKSPRATNERGRSAGDDAPRTPPPRDDDSRQPDQPSSPQTTRPPTTSPPQTSPPTTRCDSQCWQDRVNEDDPPEG